MTGELLYNLGIPRRKCQPDLLTACEKMRGETREMWSSVTDERLAEVKEDPFFGAGQQSHIERLQ